MSLSSRSEPFDPEPYKLIHLSGVAFCRFETSADALQWAQALHRQGIDPVNIYIDKNCVLKYSVMWKIQDFKMFLIDNELYFEPTP